MYVYTCTCVTLLSLGRTLKRFFERLYQEKNRGIPFG